MPADHRPYYVNMIYEDFIAPGQPWFSCSVFLLSRHPFALVFGYFPLISTPLALHVSSFRVPRFPFSSDACVYMRTCLPFLYVRVLCLCADGPYVVNIDSKTKTTFLKQFLAQVCTHFPVFLCSVCSSFHPRFLVQSLAANALLLFVC